MAAKVSQNLHVPLPGPLHARLHTQAARAGRPATVVAREAIEAWIEERERQALHEAIATYAHEVGGSRDDLDEPLERAGVEHLVGRRRRRR
jgi:predicted DNA-binding protein